MLSAYAEFRSGNRDLRACGAGRRHGLGRDLQVGRCAGSDPFFRSTAAGGRRESGTRARAGLPRACVGKSNGTLRGIEVRQRNDRLRRDLRTTTPIGRHDIELGGYGWRRVASRTRAAARPFDLAVPRWQTDRRSLNDGYFVPVVECLARRTPLAGGSRRCNRQVGNFHGHRTIRRTPDFHCESAARPSSTSGTVTAAQEALAPSRYRYPRRQSH